jgi:hypothetical protein
MKSTVKDLMKKKLGIKDADSNWIFLKEKYDIGVEARRPYERMWLINLAFIAGKQYSFYNQSTNLVQQVNVRKGKLRVVDNKILPRFQKQVSRLIRNSPRMSVVPASTDREDIKAAIKADKVLKWFWRQHQMRKKIRQLAGWIYSCGNAFMDDRWNPTMGPTSLSKEGVLTYLGDVDIGIWSPFEIGVPSGKVNDVEIDNLPWITKSKFRSLEWIAANYPNGKEVVAEERPSFVTDATMLIGDADGFTSREYPGATVVELKIRPNGEFKNGLFLTGANGIILNKVDYPYDSYHLEQFKDIEVPGLFYGIATTEAAIWLQKIWNRTLGDVAEFNRTMARGKWLIPRNAKMEVLPDDSIGQRLLYNPVLGHKPEMMDIKSLPSSYVLALETVMSSLMELYHQHEVTQGTNKSDIRSGDMVSLLLEQDDYGNIPTHAIFEESLEAVMGRVLLRIQKGYADDRIIAITGRDGQHEVFAFKGADLRNNTDVFVTKESSIPDSKIARQVRIKENFKEGLYGNPQDSKTRERVLRMLDEVPDDIKDVFAEDNLDRQIARIENEAMKSVPNVQYLVNSYDNHSIHTEEHRMERKQPEYQRLKYENPKAFTLLETCFIRHEAQHNKFLQEEQAAQMKNLQMQMEMQRQMKGGGASGGIG